MPPSESPKRHGAAEPLQLGDQLIVVEVIGAVRIQHIIPRGLEVVSDEDRFRDAPVGGLRQATRPLTALDIFRPVGGDTLRLREVRGNRLPPPAPPPRSHPSEKGRRRWR